MIINYIELTVIYVPPITGSAIIVKKADILTNCTVLIQKKKIVLTSILTWFNHMQFIPHKRAHYSASYYKREHFSRNFFISREYIYNYHSNSGKK